MTLIEELKWRGLYNQSIEGTDKLLETENVTAYIGYDPTASSLHIGNLATIMMLKHLQLKGHKPIIVMGGATGRIGDPSGKSAERNLLDEATIEANLSAQRKQFGKFLDFEGDNAAIMVNNHDWYKEMNVLTFLRDVGKHLSVNYMMAKDSVKSRLESGISFTEFSYQMLQGYDFYYLYENYACKMQMGGSDQWGNITTGSELIRRMAGGEAFGITCPLITRSDGKKFGKSEEGNVWLDAELTSPYKFYQYFLNCTDEDASKLLKVFSLKHKDEIESIIADHEGAKGARIAQKALAEELTARVHSTDDLQAAQVASQILFGKSTKEDLSQLSVQKIEEVFDGVQFVGLTNEVFGDGLTALELTCYAYPLYTSKSDVRRALKEGSLRVNKEIVRNENRKFTREHLIHNQLAIIQRGKKNYLLIKVCD